MLQLSRAPWRPAGTSTDPPKYGRFPAPLLSEIPGKSTEPPAMLHTILTKLPVSENVKVLLGSSLVFAASYYVTFNNKKGVGYDNMEEKRDADNAQMKRRGGGGASPFAQ